MITNTNITGDRGNARGAASLSEGLGGALLGIADVLEAAGWDVQRAPNDRARCYPPQRGATPRTPVFFGPADDPGETWSRLLAHDSPLAAFAADYDREADW